MAMWNLGSIRSCALLPKAQLQQSAREQFYVMHGYFDHVGLYHPADKTPMLGPGKEFDVLAYEPPGHAFLPVARRRR